MLPQCTGCAGVRRIYTEYVSKETERAAGVRYSSDMVFVFMFRKPIAILKELPRGKNRLAVPIDV